VPITAISIRVRDASGEGEQVCYDAALIFEYQDGTRFVLSANDSIAGGLQYSNSIADLTEIANECPERVAVREPNPRVGG
jgi:hypothetical protein